MEISENKKMNFFWEKRVQCNIEEEEDDINSIDMREGREIF